MYLLNCISFAGKLSKGVPTEDEHIRRYCKARKIKFPPENWNFYLALSSFRSAGIAQVLIMYQSIPTAGNHGQVPASRALQRQ